MTDTNTAVKDSNLTVKLQNAIEITMAQLVNILFCVKGVTFCGVNASVIPKMNKGGRACANTMFGKVGKKSRIGIMIGNDYENRVDKVNADKWVNEAIEQARLAGIPEATIQASITDLKAHSAEAVGEYEAKPRKWGTHMLNPYTGQSSKIMIHHTKKDKAGKELPQTYARYMQCEILSAKSAEYYYLDSGLPLTDEDMAVVRQYLVVRPEEDIKIRDYSIENITRIRINKTEYVLKG
jgi:hypothetical protein